VRRPLLVALGGIVVITAAVVFATSRDPDSSSRATRTPAGTRAQAVAEESSTTTTTTRPRRGSGEAVIFAFGGDVHFEGSLRAQLDSDPSGMLSAIAGELSAADVAMVNLETAITEGGAPEPKAYNFRAPASALTALSSVGVDVVTLANNHGEDYGPDGLADTLAAKASGVLPMVGIGNNAAEAYAPWVTVVKGQRINVIGATDVLDEAFSTTWPATDTQGGIASAKDANQARLLAAVQAARPVSDTLVVYLHWGIEGSTCPSGRQQELAQALVDAGADIVVGSHTHRVQGGGRLGAAFVDYGLGNFVFYNESGESGRSGVLTVTATGRDVDAYQWKPARIVDGIPRLLTSPDSDAAVAEWDAQRACTGLTP
jgi:poly-gamma-glutamate capsule biosynthesis protein CapA/YwtB (metallophosphatase superfamily)